MEGNVGKISDRFIGEIRPPHRPLVREVLCKPVEVSHDVEGNTRDSLVFQWRVCLGWAIIFNVLYVGARKEGQRILSEEEYCGVRRGAELLMIEAKRPKLFLGRATVFIQDFS